MRLRSFIRNEDGVSLTEYLVLLGLLTAGTITGTVSFGVSLSDAWRSASNMIPTLSASVSAEAGDGDESTATEAVATIAAQEPPAVTTVAAATTKPSPVAAETKPPAATDTSRCLPSQASDKAAQNSGKCKGN